jgi:excisionase family DNA binding protein
MEQQNKISFEQMPEMLSLLLEKISTIEKLLLSGEYTDVNKDKLLSIQEASKLLRLSVPTLYSKVSKKEIPYIKVSRKLYFSEATLMEFLKTGIVNPTNPKI